MKSRYILLVLFITVALSACSSDSDQLSDEDSLATSVVLAQTIIAETSAAIPPTATNTPIPPTPTHEVTVWPTDLPAQVFFRDDFIGQLRPEWSWLNEVPEQWTITPDGWLQITADDFGLSNTYTQNNMLLVEVPLGNLEIITHIVADPQVNFQQAGIFVYGDNQNYISVNLAFCAIGRCKTGGNGVFMDYQIGGIYWFSSLPLTESDVYLKLAFQENVFIAYYSIEPGVWIEIGRLDGYFAFSRVGIGASNVDFTSEDNDLVAQFEYFEVIQP